MPNPPSSRRALTILPLFATTACWGVGTVVTKQALDDFQPLTLLPVQLAASCVLLTLLCVIRRERLGWSPGTRRLAALGILNPGVAYALGLVGLTSITASTSVLLWAAEPVLIVVFAVVLLRERVDQRHVAALTVAVLGVVLIVYQPGVGGSTVGVTLTLAAVGCCALYTVATRHFLLDDASLPVVLAQQVAAFMFAVALVVGVELASGDGWSASGQGTGAWIGAGVSGCLYYGLAFWFYLIGLRRVDASVAGSYLPLIPVFGVSAGLLVGERLEFHQWVGACVVIAATAVLARQTPSTRSPGPDEP